jgi:hypothetical protein
MSALLVLCEKIKDSLDYAENYVEPQEEKNNKPPAQQYRNQEEDNDEFKQDLAAINEIYKEKDDALMAQGMAASLADEEKYKEEEKNVEPQEDDKQEERLKLQKQLKLDISAERMHGEFMYLCGGFNFREINGGKILILGAHPTDDHIKIITKENTNKFKSDTYTLSSLNPNNFTLEKDLFIKADLNNPKRLMNILSVQHLQFNRIIMDWAVLGFCSETWIYPNKDRDNKDRDNIWNSIHSMLKDKGEIIIPRNLYAGIVDENVIKTVRDLERQGIFDKESGSIYIKGLMHLNRMKCQNSTFDNFEKFITEKNKFDIKHCSVDHHVKFPMQVNKKAGTEIKYFYVLTKK